MTENYFFLNQTKRYFLILVLFLALLLNLLFKLIEIALVLLLLSIGILDGELKVGENSLGCCWNDLPFGNSVVPSSSP